MSNDRGDRPRDMPMAEVVDLQRLACELAGSELYGVVLGEMHAQVLDGGPTARILAPWSANALADAIPLRFLAAVHALVLDGDAPALARWYPSAGGAFVVDDAPALIGDFRAAVVEHEERIATAMHRGVQTNEVGRAASLVGGFHLVAARSGLPLRCLEIGASAGLLMRWDQYRYDAGPTSWGPDARVRFREPWTDAVPDFVADLAVGERAGCDIAPIDAHTEEGRLRLRSFLWPDQVERRSRLDAALAVAADHPVTVEAADAGAWAEARLATPTPGMATVLHHSIVLQYLPRATFDRVRAAAEAAGAAATTAAPFGWLRMEPAGEVADLRLRWWPGDGSVTDEVLATTGYHGPPVTWLGGAPTTT